MFLIRTVEDNIADSINKGEIGCPCHLYSGQEAIATGVCANLRKDDWVFSTHRSHGHFLAKGGGLDELLAEVYCRSDGCSSGRGGSMHLSDPSIGFPGSSAIVSGTISLAVGAALAFSLKGNNRISVSFFGDGAVDEGVFYESLNLAAIYRLPILFVCENNLYSTHLHITKCLADTDISKKARAMGVQAKRIDGNDVLKVNKESQRLIEKIRDGNGPQFLECMTYRYRGHVGPNYDLDKGLRSKEELEKWKKRDPITFLENNLLRSGLADEKELSRIKSEVKKTVRDAQNQAKKCVWPAGRKERSFEKVFKAVKK